MPDSGTAVVTTVPQVHGGALHAGGTPGNKGGGSVPSVLRDKLRQSYDDRRQFLDDVIDGKVLQTIELPLWVVLPYVVCPNCGEEGLEPKEPNKVALIKFEAKASATVKDRLAAIDHLARYGMGALKEVSTEQVREKLRITLELIRTTCSTEDASKLIVALKPVWTE